MRFHVRIMDVARPWRRAKDHLDGRTCPHCGATVHCNQGQASHTIWHVELDDLLIELCQRTGFTKEDIEGSWTWTAVLDGLPELEKSDDG